MDPWIQQIRRFKYSKKIKKWMQKPPMNSSLKIFDMCVNAKLICVFSNSPAAKYLIQTCSGSNDQSVNTASVQKLIFLSNSHFLFLLRKK